MKNPTVKSTILKYSTSGLNFQYYIVHLDIVVTVYDCNIRLGRFCTPQTYQPVQYHIKCHTVPHLLEVLPVFLSL